MTDQGVVFLDAEGTLWRPRPGRSAAEYWEEPTLARAEEVFEAEPGGHGLLRALRADGHRIVVLSRHVPELLDGLLSFFGYADLVDEVIVDDDAPRGAKVRWARDYLRRERIPAWACLMVGDSPEHDVEPFLADGLRAVLVDREYNRRVAVPRVATLGEVFALTAAGPQEHPQRATSAASANGSLKVERQLVDVS